MQEHALNYFRDFPLNIGISMLNLHAKLEDQALIFFVSSLWGCHTSPVGSQNQPLFSTMWICFFLTCVDLSDMFLVACSIRTSF